MVPNLNTFADNIDNSPHHIMYDHDSSNNPACTDNASTSGSSSICSGGIRLPQRKLSANNLLVEDEEETEGDSYNNSMWTSNSSSCSSNTPNKKAQAKSLPPREACSAQLVQQKQQDQQSEDDEQDSKLSFPSLPARDAHVTSKQQNQQQKQVQNAENEKKSTVSPPQMNLLSANVQNHVAKVQQAAASGATIGQARNRQPQEDDGCSVASSSDCDDCSYSSDATEITSNQQNPSGSRSVATRSVVSAMSVTSGWSNRSGSVVGGGSHAFRNKVHKTYPSNKKRTSFQKKQPQRWNSGCDLFSSSNSMKSAGSAGMNHKMTTGPRRPARGESPVRSPDRTDATATTDENEAKEDTHHTATTTVMDASIQSFSSSSKESFKGEDTGPRRPTRSASSADGSNSVHEETAATNEEASTVAMGSGIMTVQGPRAGLHEVDDDDDEETHAASLDPDLDLKSKPGVIPFQLSSDEEEEEEDACYDDDEDDVTEGEMGDVVTFSDLPPPHRLGGNTNTNNNAPMNDGSHKNEASCSSLSKHTFKTAVTAQTEGANSKKTTHTASSGGANSKKSYKTTQTSSSGGSSSTSTQLILTEERIRSHMKDYYEDYDSIFRHGQSTKACWEAFFDQYFTKDILWVRSTGNPIGREGLATLLADDITGVRMTLVDIESIQLIAGGLAAVVVFTADQVYLYKGKPESDRTVITSVMHVVNGCDILISHEHRCVGKPIPNLDARWES